MTDDGLLKNNARKEVAQSLYETPSEAETQEYNGLKTIEIDIEQVEYL